MDNSKFFIYLLVMAGVTYLVRAIPMALIKEKIKNKFVLSFLHYIPYTVLSAMTVPAIFYATDSPITAAVGFVVALVAADHTARFQLQAMVAVAVWLVAHHINVRIVIQFDTIIIRSVRERDGRDEAPCRTSLLRTAQI